MKFTSAVLQLLALCQIASASPCNPSLTVTSAATASTTEASQTESSTAFIHETTATTDYETLSGSSTIATSIATSSVEVETTTTTTAASGPTNLISNPGFEGSTIAPWTIYNNVGALSIASGSGIPPSPQAGQFSASGENLSNMGITQNLDSSLITVDQEYRFSVYTKVTASNFCISQTIACGAGTGFVNSANWGAMQANGWILTTVTCSWNEAQLDAGPSVQVTGLLAVCELTSASPCKPPSQTSNSITPTSTSSFGNAEVISRDIFSTTSLTTESATFTDLSSSVLSAGTESVTSTAVPSSASVTETESSIIASSETTTIAESTATYELSLSTTLATTSAETSIDETPTTTKPVKQQPTNLIRNPGFEDPTFAPWEAQKIGNRGWLSVRSDTSRPGSLQCGVFDSSNSPAGGLKRRLIQPWTWTVKQYIEPSKIMIGKDFDEDYLSLDVTSKSHPYEHGL
ncbi:hypothetical protein FPCIR_2587 [Fusarium pseudocircinatum]|uniref:CBM-cenC domain-containing protein n=1 Tax=Fusarium pseudocircinatum TaxID=56676 RepID=A0A8H5UTV1_9HYPO|nr:hypothetical protein FPCIR_2587 [Fusarium pseudocircinatum]